MMHMNCALDGLVKTENRKSTTMGEPCGRNLHAMEEKEEYYTCVHDCSERMKADMQMITAMHSKPEHCSVFVRAYLIVV